jgi:hypothetical protein
MKLLIYSNSFAMLDSKKEPTQKKKQKNLVLKETQHTRAVFS